MMQLFRRVGSMYQRGLTRRTAVLLLLSMVLLVSLAYILMEPMEDLTGIKILGYNNPKYASTQGRLILEAKARLGNHVNQYAVLYVLAKKTNRYPVFVPMNPFFSLESSGRAFQKLFPNLSAQIRLFKLLKNTAVVNEAHPATYRPDMEQIIMSLEEVDDVKICCYLESYKYFEGFESDLRKELQLSSHYRSWADGILHMAAEKYNQSATDNVKSVTFVGVHVRRGDKVHSGGFGFRIANKTYLEKSMNYYRGRYNHTVFILTSDDKAWLYQHFTSPDVFIGPGRDAAGDFAILMLCNHTVMTVGTFGYWTGLLAGGEVTYLKDHVVNGSGAAGFYQDDFHFPPYWIPISN